MLPFDKLGQVVKQGGEVVANDVPLSIWQLTAARQTSAGESYDYTGEADAAFAGELVSRVNRSIVVDGKRLKIISAIAMEYLPHVALELREIKGG